MPRFAANISMMFQEAGFLDRFAAARAAGFGAVEMMFPYDHRAEQVAQAAQENGLSIALFNIAPGDWDGGERGLAALPGREAEFEEQVARALKFAGKVGCVRLHAMAGVGDAACRDTYIGNLAMAARMAEPHGVEILIEPINTYDMPGYFLTRTEDAVEVIKAVDRGNLGLQFDLYHRHRMQGGVLEAIPRFAEWTRHYQIAGPPDRGEPDVTDWDLLALMEAIDDTGYGGWVGCEYRPRGRTGDGLAWMKDFEEAD